MRGPVTPKVSLRYIASHIEARVFSSAHTPVSPPGFSSRTSIVPPISTPAKRRSTVPSASACSAEEVVLAVRAGGVVRVGAAGHAELVRVVAARVLHSDAVLQRLAHVAARDAVDAADVGRQAEEAWNSS